ncbi:alpha-2-macroglobulin-like isoform X2 [Clupea harengus]|uniref:Alpha-2-macroglobulin-like isoform X2 n=1 Tax=Clupea harengus TaxID=7950 RepID=A0A6P8GKD2_CLUHA|nr:alpha-2-macroglobulin-like isoform X2 [Clupea harengus]
MALVRILIAGGLLSCLYSLCSSTETPEPSFLVTFPALMRSESEAQLCASLLSPNETLLMSIYLTNGDEKKLLHQETSDKDFHRCFQFQAPSVNTDSVQKIKVEVKGQTSHWTKESSVTFRPKPAPITFIQTDKPIYSPGQTVHFRVVTMDTNFIPLSEKYNLVSLVDSRRNTIGQWLNVTSQGKIVQLSHVLNSEAPQGEYMLRVDGEHSDVSHQFQVKKYVLPKFDITLNTPEKISVGAEEVRLVVCAKYTFGQPVPGKASMSLCRDADETVPQKPCSAPSVEMDESGCASHVFIMSVFTQPDFAEKLRNSFTFSATVTEEGTGISRSESKDMRLDFNLGKLTFVDTPDVIEDGAVMEGKIKAIHYNDTGIADRTIHLFKGPTWSAELLLNLTTGSDGVAQFSLNTTTFTGDFELIASLYTDIDTYRPYNTPHYDSASKSVSRLRPASSHTATSSSVTIKAIDEPLQCDKDTPISIKYTFTGETFNTDSVDIIYMVLSKGEIVHNGFTEASVKGSQPVITGEVSFKLPVNPGMAPSVQVLAYCVLPSETVLAESRTFSTEKCFRNKVLVQFSPPKAVPGEKSSLQLSAQPGSLCGLSAVDQSILILEPGKRLDAQKVFGLLHSSHLDLRVPHDYEPPEDCLKVRPRRSSVPYYPSRRSDDGVLAVFKKLGLKTATNLVLRAPDCLLYKGERYRKGGHYERNFQVSYSMAGSGSLQPDSPSEEFGVTVRTVFPETWIWDLAEVGESGEAQVPLTVPDTITTWETEAFCLSPQGFGLAPPVQLTVFQPFFLELSLPYSIIRGETFELKATVFNYLPKCIMVTVTPAPSSDFTLTPSSDGQYSSCLCANGRKTFKWTLVPSVLGLMNVTMSAEATQSQAMCGNEVVSVPEKGRMDIVTRPLLVKAEGSEKTESFNWLLCPKGGALTEEVELKLPAAVVKGSARASVSVLGDVLGRALKNIGSLLKMPYGCGEQNMAILSPNIYILQYLQNTNQLTADIRERATNFLKNGYQRQLNYKHRDGAYSTFGEGEGNTWLTAFVLRSFGKAKSFTYIDPHIIASAKAWLEGKLRPDGVFHMQGKLFNNRMKGGVNDDVTITAYITASMLELNMTVTEKTLTFLKSSVSDLSNTYSTALLAYTFSLAGEEDIQAQLLKHLDSVATSDGSLLHWSQSSSERADSLAVETSSYVLLAVLSKTTLTAADLGYAARIVNWLVKQQNPYGGFSSTQDTVVALQALALYATKVFSPRGSSTVTVQSAGGDKHQFDVNQHNTLLYQERALQDVPGKYSVEVKGSACASVGVALFFNIPTPTEHSTLSIKTQAKPLTEAECNKANGQAFNLDITVQYDGPQESTNMAIIDVKMLSGFTPDSASVEKLEGSIFVDRVDKKDDHILVYLSEVPKGLPVSYHLTIRQDLPVNNLKPAVVKVYDYYQTSDQAEAEYSSPCA